MSTEPILYLQRSPELELATRALQRGPFERTVAGPMILAQKEAVKLVKNRARKYVAAHRVTGKLRAGIRTRGKGSGIRYEASVKSTGAVSNLIVGGVRPHPIAPGRVMPLWGGRGAWKKGTGRGIEGFATAVEHPGFKGDPFFARAIDDSRPEIDHLLQVAADGMVRDLARAMGG